MNTKQQLQLVTFEQAKRLKEAGFDWDVSYYYDTDGKLLYWYDIAPNQTITLKVPTVALTLKWIEEVKGLHYYVADLIGCFKFCIWKNDEWIIRNGFKNRDQSESALLDELLTLIEKEK